MTRTLEIAVHYPAGPHRRMVLRAAESWDRDIDPVDRDDAGHRFTFRLASDLPFVYFKPMLIDGEAAVWSQGENFLAVMGEGTPVDVHPHFFEDASCSLCTRQEVPSSFQRHAHAVRVFLPPGYAENTLARYPVLYMQDGHNLFFPGESHGGRHWRIPETLKILDAMNLTRRVIVVGVHPGDRMVEYTAPGYEAYGRFLAEELKPWVDASYRTLPGPGDTSVMGSSLGGVVSLYLAWQRPDLFGAAACLSSTFGWRDDLLHRVRTEARRDVRIYLDSGWPADNYEVTRAMRAALRDRGYEEGKELLYFAFPEARHDEGHWAMRAHIPLQFFHGRPPRPLRPPSPPS